MIQIDKTLISLDIIEKEFVCDVAVCKGICCVEGDCGAPLTDLEVLEMQKVLPHVLPFVSEKNREILLANGVYYHDFEGEKVTTLVNNVECAFVYIENGIQLCAIEKAYREGLISFIKPISCHLYPIRCKQYAEFEALNYDVWHICSNAVCKGKKEGVKIYEFLKEPLIRKYGAKWYKQLETAAKQWLQQKSK